MSDRILICDLQYATLKGVNSGNANEFEIDEKLGAADDALALRFGTRRSGVKLSFDRLPDGHDRDRDHPAHELCMIKVVHDDNYPKDVDVLCVEVAITDPSLEYGDAAERTILRLGLKKGLELIGIPFTPGSTPVPPSGGAVYSYDNKLMAVQQGDGNFVVYLVAGMVPQWDRFSAGLANDVPLLAVDQPDKNFVVYGGATPQALWDRFSAGV